MRVLSKWGKFRLFLGREPMTWFAAIVLLIIPLVYFTQIILGQVGDSIDFGFFIPMAASTGILLIKWINYKRNYHILQTGAYTRARVEKVSRTLFMINQQRVFEYKLNYKVAGRDFHLHKSSTRLKGWKKKATIGIHYLPEKPEKTFIPTLYGIKTSYVRIVQTL
mgnify:CR=1 FL=1